MNMPSDLMRQTEAAEYLNVTRQYINKLVRNGKLRTYTVAKLISRADIEKLKNK